MRCGGGQWFIQKTTRTATVAMDRHTRAVRPGSNIVALLTNYGARVALADECLAATAHVTLRLGLQSPSALEYRLFYLPLIIEGQGPGSG